LQATDLFIQKQKIPAVIDKEEILELPGNRTM
jgi:hypothetical protein